MDEIHIKARQVCRLCGVQKLFMHDGLCIKCLAAQYDQRGAALAEIERLRGLLKEAAWHVEYYGDSRKDRQLYLRLKAAADGKPEPSDDEIYGSGDSVG